MAEKPDLHSISTTTPEADALPRYEMETPRHDIESPHYEAQIPHHEVQSALTEVVSEKPIVVPRE